MDDLLRSGAFASLCGTTKETLRHYSRIGLFEPSVVGINGYKYYRPSQVVDFMVISSLKEAGCSLSEIGFYISEPDLSGMMDIFSEKVKKIEGEEALLARKKKVLKDILARIDEVGFWAKDGLPRGWIEEDGDEAYYLETPIPVLSRDSKAIFESVAAHEAYCNQQGVGFGIEWPKTYRLEKSCFEEGHYNQSLFLCTRIAEPIDSARMTLRPKGRYLHYLAQASLAPSLSSEGLESHPFYSLFDALKEHMREKGLRAKGDIFVTEEAQSKFDGEEFLVLRLNVRV